MEIQGKRAAGQKSSAIAAWLNTLGFTGSGATLNDYLNEKVQDTLLAELELLEKYGPQLNRPHVDTLNASKYANMKELRFSADGGVWRAAFAFDPERKAIVLVAAVQEEVKAILWTVDQESGGTA